MLLLVIGLLVFLGIHLLPTASELRTGLVARFGGGTYKAVFSLISLVGLVMIVLGYHKLQVMTGKNVQLWDPPTWTRHVTFLLMLPAIVFLVASQIPSRIRTTLKHPMLIAIKTWALAHLLANGDLGSLVLFGSFLAYAVYDRISLKRRVDGRGPLGDRTGGLLGDVLVIVIGLALYVGILLWGHEALIGVPLISARGAA